jgi:hypothetical protein
MQSATLFNFSLYDPSTTHPRPIKLVGYARENDSITLEDQKIKIATYLSSLLNEHRSMYSKYINASYIIYDDIEFAIKSLNTNDVFYITSLDILDTEYIYRIKTIRNAIFISGDMNEEMKMHQEKALKQILQNSLDFHYKILVSIKVHNTITNRKLNLQAWTGIPPFGYSKDVNKYLIFNEEEQIARKRILELVNEKKNNFQIAKILNNEKYIKNEKSKTEWNDMNVNRIKKSIIKHQWLQDALELKYKIIDYKE